MRKLQLGNRLRGKRHLLELLSLSLVFDVTPSATKKKILIQYTRGPYTKYQRPPDPGAARDKTMHGQARYTNSEVPGAQEQSDTLRRP